MGSFLVCWLKKFEAERKFPLAGRWRWGSADVSGAACGGSRLSVLFLGPEAQRSGAVLLHDSGQSMKKIHRAAKGLVMHDSTEHTALFPGVKHPGPLRLPDMGRDLLCGINRVCAHVSGQWVWKKPEIRFLLSLFHLTCVHTHLQRCGLRTGAAPQPRWFSAFWDTSPPKPPPKRYRRTRPPKVRVRFHTLSGKRSSSAAGSG